jgi:hypothetical protein
MVYRKQLEHELSQAEIKAWDSLSRYKFQMFGYWAAIWVHLNKIGEFKRPNPFKGLVKAAREQQVLAEQVLPAYLAVEPADKMTDADRHYQAGYDDAVAYLTKEEGRYEMGCAIERARGE